MILSPRKSVVRLSEDEVPSEAPETIRGKTSRGYFVLVVAFVAILVILLVLFSLFPALLPILLITNWIVLIILIVVSALYNRISRRRPDPFRVWLDSGWFNFNIRFRSSIGLG